MIDNQKAAIILVNTIKGTRHKDYERTVSLAKEYHALISGDGVDDLLRRYVKRENEADFQQRKDITEAVTPAVAEKIKSPFAKVGRVDNVLKRRKYKEDGERNKIIALEESLEHFHGDEDLDSYMETSFIDNSFSDPNQFIVVEFDTFTAKDGEKAQPFPVEIPSEDALNYKYKNNKLQWLIARRPTTFIKTEGKKRTLIEGFRYLAYTKNDIIQLRQVDVDDKIKDSIKEGLQFDENGILIPEQVIKVGNDFFRLILSNPEAEQVQAIRIGYKKDLVTKGRTFVSPMHPALARFRKTLKSVSEMDLTATLHAHPHKIQFEERCPGEVSAPCNKGKTMNGQTCSKCAGSGTYTMISAQDTTILPMPKAGETMVDLSKLSHFEAPPIDLLKYMDEYTEKLEAKAVKDVFASETFNRSKSVATATEVNIDMQSVYDVLWPFAKQWSIVWTKLTRLTAIFTTNNDGLSISHQFPKDFKMKTVENLIQDLDAANKAGAPDFVRTELARDIAQKLFLDNPHMIKVFDVKEQHKPFKGKSQDEVMFIISSEAASLHDRVLWANEGAIFNELEQDLFKKGVDFYDLGYETRVALLDQKVMEFIDKVEGGKIGAVSFNDSEDVVIDPDQAIEGEDIPQNVSAQAEAQARLKGSVGGVQAILGIQQAVSSGTTSEAAAIAILNNIFGFDRETALSLLQ